MSDRFPGVFEAAEVIELWPDGPPRPPSPPLQETIVERSKDCGRRDRILYNISRPRMTVLRPSHPNGVGVLMMPGGGFMWLAVDKEGYHLGPVLAAQGYTVFTLLYRLPGEGWGAGPDVALSDAQRAMRLIRQGAAGFGIRPDKVVAVGFSAGGHVCADLATRFDQATYDPVDDADRLNARPDRAALLYPVQSMSAPFAHEESRARLLGPHPSDALERAHTPAFNITPATPPCFLVHAEDDPVVSVENTLLFRDALKSKGIPVETHLFVRGGHGFGLGVPAVPPSMSWPHLLLSWMIAEGMG